MADERNAQPSRSQQIRNDSAVKEQKIEEAFAKALKSDAPDLLKNFLHAFGLAIVWGVSSLPEIAAQLAEANERDREAEIQAKAAQDFVAGIQQELARQGVIIPGGMASVKGRGGK